MLNRDGKRRVINETLFRDLKNIIAGDRNVKRVQELSYFKKRKDNFEFHDDENIADRAAYFENVAKKAETVKIIFFDPDNGIEPLKKTNNAEKFLFWSEVKRFWNMGKDILIFQYFPWFCNRGKYTEKRIVDCVTKIGVSKGNVIAFNAKIAVYLFLTHDMNDMKKELAIEWRKWEK